MESNKSACNIPRRRQVLLDFDESGNLSGYCIITDTVEDQTLIEESVQSLIRSKRRAICFPAWIRKVLA